MANFFELSEKINCFIILNNKQLLFIIFMCFVLYTVKFALFFLNISYINASIFYMLFQLLWFAT